MLRFRHLLLCLLMLALPLQGFAAASMLYCSWSPSHETAQSQMIAVEPHHADGMALQHEHLQAALLVQQVDKASDVQSQLPDATHKCGVCASCCSVVAIADLPRTVAISPSPHADLAEPFVLIDTVPSRQPEKPPRA
ncbi:MAG: hypothetical protein PSV26_00265 [Polaromonas sp.]|uniref:hypothetical protein n=1 Tax=Polaromonas sp. TaxID=1869339 RepID=UPI0024898614|nr:hypothetical protein [Polaromonas sp.]MDI1235896.1 hypothetical protein [Polaromonas sp.]